MCGIAGLWAPRMPPADRLEHVARMVRRLRHRGPSGEALWNGPGIALGIARLAIVEPGAPARVLESESGAVSAVVNGEIYNHAALRLELLGRGHRVPEGPDTAVIPHLYEEMGADFPLPLDGMFAAAVWDARSSRLTLARDRAGEKPLFVAGYPHRLAFASEPAALLELPWVSRDPAPAALARYLAHGCFAGEDSAFADLRQLPPAHTLVLEEEGERLTRYWRPWDTLAAARRAGPTLERAPAATLAALESAVASRVPGEVPFGVFLSGGVDSGLVATLAARAVGHRFPTFSLRMAARGYDESSLARTVATSIGSDHHELAMDAASGEEALEQFAASMDQPLGDPSVLPTWALARLAAGHVPVVLTGEGGDELFAGYPTYLGHRHAAIAERLPGPLSAAALALARRFRPRHHHVTLAHLIERFLGVRGLDPFERHLSWFGTASPREARALLSPALRAGLSEADPVAHLRRIAGDLESAGIGGPRERPEVLAYQLLDFEIYLPGDLLTKVDRATMAHGLESRAPFLRHRLVEFALALPESARLRGVTGKWALKRAARSLLPAELLRRRKKGFSPPFSAWARGPLRACVLARLARARLTRTAVLDPDAVQAVLDAHLSNRADRGRTLWAILSLQMWAERWLAAAAPGAAASLEGERDGMAAEAASAPRVAAPAPG